MANLRGINLEWKTRECHVDGRCGHFLTWEYYSEPVGASPMIGGPPAGVISRLFAIVEFVDGVERVDPWLVKFCDLDHADLCAWQKYENEQKIDEKPCSTCDNSRFGAMDSSRRICMYCTDKCNWKKENKE